MPHALTSFVRFKGQVLFRRLLEWRHVLAILRNILPIHHFSGCVVGWTTVFGTRQTSDSMMLIRIAILPLGIGRGCAGTWGTFVHCLLLTTCFAFIFCDFAFGDLSLKDRSIQWRTMARRRRRRRRRVGGTTNHFNFNHHYLIQIGENEQDQNCSSKQPVVCHIREVQQYKEVPPFSVNGNVSSCWCHGQQGTKTTKFRRSKQ